MTVLWTILLLVLISELCSVDHFPSDSFFFLIGAVPGEACSLQCYNCTGWGCWVAHLHHRLFTFGNFCYLLLFFLVFTFSTSVQLAGTKTQHSHMSKDEANERRSIDPQRQHHSSTMSHARGLADLQDCWSTHSTETVS